MLNPLKKTFQSEMVAQQVTTTGKYLPAQLHHGSVLAAVEVQLAEETVFDVV